MELQDLCSSIADFSNWRHADVIKLFAWHLHTHDGKPHFASGDIAGCYRALNLAPPSAIPPFITAMERRKPPEVLKSASGYTLERRIKQELDERYGQRGSTVHVHKLLLQLPSKIPDLGEKSYLEEALICFQHKAFRAAVVMCWNVTFDHLCQFVLTKHLNDFNTQLPRTYPRADISAVSKRDDFAELKEFQVLQVCKSARIISDGVFKILKEKLDRRNMAAHPSGVAINDVTAEEIIRDLVENVVVKLK